MRKYTNKSSPGKQNKDGANAARTARITLVSLILEQDHLEVLNILQRLRESTQIKKLMLNIGEKEFKDRFLFRPELKEYFNEVF